MVTRVEAASPACDDLNVFLNTQRIVIGESGHSCCPGNREGTWICIRDKNNNAFCLSLDYNGKVVSVKRLTLPAVEGQLNSWEDLWHRP